MIKSLFTKLRLPKLSQKAWITLRELPKYFEKVIWITRTEQHKDAYIILRNRITTLIKRSGFQFTFFYLKEVLRLVIRSLSGSPEPKYLKGVMVKRDHNGLPTIIPLSLRKILLDFRSNQRVVVCILGLLSVFRVFPTKVAPSLGTILEPFGGITQTIDSLAIKAALVELAPKPFRIRPVTLLKIETTSPNAKKSAWGASLDAVAFIDHPIALYNYIKYMIFTKNYLHLMWLISIIVVSFPIVIGLKIGKGGIGKLNMGRLSVVYDQAGKARIVAITNWWIQIALKPLHDSLFRILERINQDGTFNQTKPFEELISRKDLVGRKFYSFDLSAATDRLPVALQRDILNVLYPSFGTLWANLLDLKWTFKGKEYKYAVGQPMGAYSSWAMLALTHHVVVRVAAHKVGIVNFRDYCILGDDIVIRNDLVAQEYYNLMKALGVSINLSKSVESFDFAEFAKRWCGPEVSLTPIGPGLVLRLIRDKTYLAMFICEAWKLSLFSSLNEVLAIVRQLRSNKSYRSQLENVLWSCFGLRGFTLSKERYMDVDNTIIYCFSSTVNYLPVLRYHICNALLQLQYDDIREAKRRLEEEEKFFYQNWWRTYSSNWPMRLLEAFLKVIGPGFWIYATSFEESRESLENQRLLNPDYSWDSIRELVRSDPLIGVDSIDWTQKKLIKDQSARMRKFYKELERSQMEAPELFEENVFW